MWVPWHYGIVGFNALGWKNFPIAEHGKYSGKEKEPTIILKALAGHNLWIWHRFFGLPESLNNINVLDRSQVLYNCQDRTGLLIEHKVNGNDCTLVYYFSNGIYPKYSILVKSISKPQGQKNKHFFKCHKGRTLSALLGLCRCNVQLLGSLASYGTTQSCPQS